MKSKIGWLVAVLVLCFAGYALYATSYREQPAAGSSAIAMIDAASRFATPPEFICPIVGFGSWNGAIPNPTDPKWCAGVGYEYGPDNAGHDLYWRQRAEIEKDQRYCAMITSEYYRPACYADMARQLRKPELCRYAVGQFWSCEPTIASYAYFDAGTQAPLNWHGEEAARAAIRPTAERVITALQKKDFTALAAFVDPDPERAVYFNFGDPARSVRVSQQQLMTGYFPAGFSDFFDRYVWFKETAAEKVQEKESVWMARRVGFDGAPFPVSPDISTTYQLPLRTSTNTEGVIDTSITLLFRKADDIGGTPWYLVATLYGETNVKDSAGD